MFYLYLTIIVILSFSIKDTILSGILIAIVTGITLLVIWFIPAKNLYELMFVIW